MKLLICLIALVSLVSCTKKPEGRNKESFIAETCHNLVFQSIRMNQSFNAEYLKFLKSKNVIDKDGKIKNPGKYETSAILLFNDKDVDTKIRAESQKPVKEQSYSNVEADITKVDSTFSSQCKSLAEYVYKACGEHKRDQDFNPCVVKTYRAEPKIMSDLMGRVSNIKEFEKRIKSQVQKK